MPQDLPAQLCSGFFLEARSLQHLQTEQSAHSPSSPSSSSLLHSEELKVMMGDESVSHENEVDF